MTMPASAKARWPSLFRGLGMFLLFLAIFPIACTNSDSESKQSMKAINRQVLSSVDIAKIREELITTKNVQSPDKGYFNIDDEVETSLNLSKQASPTTSYDFRNPIIGLAFKIPFNPDWLNKRYSLPPYWELGKNKMSFGKLQYNWHGLEFYREIDFSVLEKRTAKVILNEIKNNSFLLSGPTSKEIGEIQYIEWQVQYPESAPTTIIEIMGKKNNFRFTANGNVKTVYDILESFEG